MAQTTWLSSTLPPLLPPSVSAERRSDFGMSVDNASITNSHTSSHAHNHSSVAPRPIPPPSDLNRWDLAGLLNPPAGYSRDRKMSLDFSTSPAQQPQHALYSQPEVDQPYHLHPADNTNSPSSHHHLPGNMQSHTFEHPETIDSPEHPNYDIFPAAPSGSFSSHRYRTNASSSSSLGPNYGMNSDGIYTHSSFSDSLPSFGGSNGNPYDMINSLPSSYSSGKVSPLTPSDPVGGLHHSPGFPPHVNGNKDFSSQNYPDMPDRRYQPDIMEDFSIGGMNGNHPFPPSALQHFQDRLGRFQPENRFGHSSGPPTTVPSHGPPGSDILRGIPPHATHSFREGGVPGYEDMPHYMGANPHQDLSLRMPTVDETLARMKLQGHSIMGSSNDLQTFIRYTSAYLA